MVYRIGVNTKMRIFFKEAKTNTLRILAMSEEFACMINDQDQMVKMIFDDMNIKAVKPILGLYENTPPPVTKDTA